MKTTRKIIITLIAPLLLLVMAVPITLAQNGIEGLKSLFTPQRPGIQFIPRETDGFSYPSFNNFIGNTKIENTRLSPGDPSPIPGDERVFLVGHTCPDGDCLQRPVLFGNTPDPVTDGDTVRFSIYFHNNGEDPFDDDGETSPNAEDVQIGIDLTNMPVDPEHPDMLRPKGFISASNQEYRWNPDSNARIGNVIIDAAGNTMTRANQQPLRVATDDLQLLLGEEGLQFDVIENSIQLAMDTSGDGVNNDVVFQIDEPMQIEIPTPDPNDGDEVVTINATPRQDDQRIWLEFDELPGCFAYSGFVYFDVRVFKEEEPPEAVCTGITYDAPFSDRGAVTVDGRSYRPIKIDEINFSDGVVPPNAKLKFTSADPNGDFRINNRSRGSGPLELPANAVSVLYAGNGPVTVEVINVEESEENICKVEIENNACEDISFNFALHRQIGPIQQGNDGRFAQWLQVDSVEFENGSIPANARLHWTSDNPDGEFYFTLLGLGPIGDPLPDIDNDPNTITVETPANNNAGRTLFYFGGEDSIEIKISPEDIQAKCVEEVSFNNPQICTELIVNHNDPIIEGYVSEFSAVAVDENGDTYTEGDGIRYSVDEGFGQFFNEQPDEPPMSPAPFINNNELRSIEIEFSQNRPAWMNAVVENIGGFDGNFGFDASKSQIDIEEIDLTGNGNASWWNNSGAELSDEAKARINPTIELTEEQRENLDKTPKFNFGATNTFNFSANKGKKTATETTNIIKPGNATTVKPKPSSKPSKANQTFPGLIQTGQQQVDLTGVKVQTGNVIFGGAGGFGAAANSVEAQANESVYLDAEQGSDGENVVHVQQLDENGEPTVDSNNKPICSADFPIEDLICRSINVVVKDTNNRVIPLAEPLAPNMLYAIHGRSTFFTENGFGPVHKQGSGIRYNVDENYGIFVAINPTLIPVRQALLNGTTFANEAELRAFVTGLGQDADAFIIGAQYDGNNPDVAALITFNSANAGEHLFFLTINTTGQDAGDENIMCGTSRNIEVPEEPPLVCTELNATINEIVGGAEVQTMEPDQMYTITASSTFEGGEPAGQRISYAVSDQDQAVIIDINQLPEGLIRSALFVNISEIQNDPNRTFDRAALEALLRGGGLDPANILVNVVEVAPGEQAYVVTYSANGASREDLVTIVQLADEAFDGARNCMLDIPLQVPPPEEEPICTELTYTVNGREGVPTVDRNGAYIVSAESTFENGPVEGDEIIYEVNSEYGTIITNPLLKVAVQGAITAGEEITSARLAEIAQATGVVLADGTAQNRRAEPGEEVMIIIYADADPAGLQDAITIQEDAEGVAGLENCNAEIAVPPEQEQPPLICIDLGAPQIQQITNPDDLVAPLQRQAVNVIERNGVYEVTAPSSSFNGPVPVPNQVRYTLDPRYGVIFNPSHEVMENLAIRDMAIRSVGLLGEFRGFTPESMQALLATADNPRDIVSNDITVDAGTTVLIATYSNAPLGAAVLRIAQVGEDIDNLEDCVVEIPIPNEDICIDLSVNARGGAFNPRANQTVFEITGNFQGHNGGIVATITEGSGTISRLNDEGQENQRSIRFFENEVQSENVLVFVYHGDANMARDARVTISVKAVDDANLPVGICQDTVTNVPEEVICTDLTITRPDSPWEVDSDSPDRQSFNIEVDTDPSGHSSDFYYTWEATDGGKWVGDGSRLTEKGRLQQTLENYNDNTSVRVWASEDANGNNPIPACVDSINAREKDKPDRPNNPPDKPKKPEIEKVVYPESKIEKADDLINISDRTKTKYVTYMAVYTPGSEKSVEIVENEMKNSKIKSPDLGGEFTLSGMEIIAIKDVDDHVGDIIYKSPTYVKDKEKGNNLSDMYYNVANKNYDCDVRDAHFCIEDFGDVEPNFARGPEGGIRFDHIDDIGPKGRIVIKYQMENRSKITAESCKTLSAISGCGEKFRNVISFTAYDDASFKGSDTEEGKDRAEAVVMCPYALSRQGGDVLFHDIIDSGVDVARCSPVKGSTGIGVKIIPVPEVDAPITSTGGGEVVESVSLTRPTHDICKFSNQKAVEGDEDYAKNYNDELANFSSSVCELKAELSSTLYETSINASISANISRIARWSKNLDDANVDTLSTVNLLDDVNNAASGVFVKTNGDLTIDGGTTGLEIKATDVINGGQTYIVIGHDLIINSDIKYTTPDYLKPRTIGSAAFIVIGGDIIVDKGVKELAGIYMAVNVDKDGKKLADKGQIRATEKSEIPLVVNGGLYGNVNSLFSNRVGIGDPRYDEGSITIKYDERLLLNMPPGIGELINVQQAIVPN